jgi:hypothetical protein
MTRSSIPPPPTRFGSGASIAQRSTTGAPAAARVVQRAAGGAPGGAPGPAPAPILGAAPIAVAYANNFQAKHTVAALTTAAAETASNARNPRPAYNTVFRRAFIETTITGVAVGLQAGLSYNLKMPGRAHPVADVLVCERNKNGNLRVMAPTPLYSYTVNFALSADGHTVTIGHCETGFD